MADLRLLVAPGGWRDSGGEGEMFNRAGILIVRSSPAVHADIKALLAALRGVRPASDVAIHPGDDGPRPDDKAILTALHRIKPSVSYVEISLRDALDRLRKSLTVNLHADWRRLKNRGPDPDAQVAVRLENATEEAVLRAMLAQPAAAAGEFMVEDGILLVTVADRIDRRQITRVYRPGGWADPAENLEKLADRLQSAVQPDARQANSGTATVRPLAGRLVARASRRQHDMIRAALRRLREADRAVNGRPAARSP